MLSQARKEEVVEFCQELIRIPSYSGQEKDLALALKAKMEALAFDEVIIDQLGNCIGIIRGRRPGKTILFDGHMDTVGVTSPEQWQHDPFAAELVDGKIYGRGASDMKGSLAAMVCAAGFLAQDLGKDWAGNLAISGTVHEERFEGVAAQNVYKIVQPDYVVIGEASELNLKIGQRGRAEVVVETYGRSAHSSNPEVGINAVYAMAQFINAMRSRAPEVHPLLGKGIFELTDIISSPYPGASVVPDKCRATYDRRLLVGETKEEVLAQVQEVLEALKKKDPRFQGRAYYAQGEDVCYTGARLMSERFYPAWLLEESHEYVQRALTGLKSQGLSPQITVYSFCTNGSFFAGQAQVPTIGFGPSREELAHVIDEYIEVSQLEGAVKGFYGIAKAVLEG